MTTTIQNFSLSPFFQDLDKQYNSPSSSEGGSHDASFDSLGSCSNPPSRPYTPPTTQPEREYVNYSNSSSSLSYLEKIPSPLLFLEKAQDYIPPLEDGPHSFDGVLAQSSWPNSQASLNRFSIIKKSHKCLDEIKDMLYSKIIEENDLATQNIRQKHPQNEILNIRNMEQSLFYTAKKNRKATQKIGLLKKNLDHLSQIEQEKEQLVIENARLRTEISLKDEQNILAENAKLRFELSSKEDQIISLRKKVAHFKRTNLRNETLRKEISTLQNKIKDLTTQNETLRKRVLSKKPSQNEIKRRNRILEKRLTHLEFSHHQAMAIISRFSDTSPTHEISHTTSLPTMQRC